MESELTLCDEANREFSVNIDNEFHKVKLYEINENTDGVENSVKKFDTFFDSFEVTPRELLPLGNNLRPQKSYAALISEAIYSTNDKKMTLNGIYSYLMSNYVYFLNAKNGWQVICCALC